MKSSHDIGFVHAPNSQTGFSLIELVVFITVVGILAAAISTAFSTALHQQGTTSDVGSSAVQLAQERMELILAQRRTQGFAAFSSTTFDPCTAAIPSTQPVCTVIPTGYTVGATFTDNWSGDTNYKVVDVTVTGPSQASLTALVANY
jgi:prepilin-type N-terminal cleavage/methylation domain-containing protein